VTNLSKVYCELELKESKCSYSYL